MRIVLALICLLLLPATAAAQIDEAADALRTDPVYVDPGTQLLGMEEAQSIRERIRDTGAAPLFVAVIPAVGDPNAALLELERKTGRDGTYVLVAGRTLRADSNVLDSGTIRSIADDAVARRRGSGLLAILDDLIAQVGSARRGEETGTSGRDSGGSGGGSLLPLLLIGGAGFAAFSFFGRRRRRREEAEALVAVKREAQTDLLALADDIRALDLDVEMPGASPEGKEQYALAVAAYDRADDAMDAARAPQDMAAVSEALEEGRYAMAAAKALLAGKRPPERTAPCFFDPRHGPSSREVEWAPPNGTPRPVPACEADAQRVERGEDPSYREVEGRPYWEAGPAYAPYAGGFFGGGLFPGLLVGSMLGGAMFPPIGYGDSEIGGGGFGGGDFGGGGGGFGGGDFGGGGGDFGGGDF